MPTHTLESLMSELFMSHNIDGLPFNVEVFVNLGELTWNIWEQNLEYDVLVKHRNSILFEPYDDLEASNDRQDTRTSNQRTT